MNNFYKKAVAATISLGVLFVGQIAVARIYNPSPSTSLTPWTSDIDGGGYSLSNVATTTTGELRMTSREGFSISEGGDTKYIAFPALSSIAIGNKAMNKSTSTGNTAIGHRVAYMSTNGPITGIGNTMIGYGVMIAAQPDSANNTAVGAYSLYNSFGASSVAIGHSAGRYNDSSDSFYINNRDLTDTAGDKAYSLLYGKFGTGASTVGQTLTVNAASTTIKNVATSTLIVDTSSASQGSCLKLKDFDGGGYTYVTVLDGVLTASADSCE